MTRDEFMDLLGEKFGDRWGPRAPDAVLPLTANSLADMLEKLGLLTEKPQRLISFPPGSRLISFPPGSNYSLKCPVCGAMPHKPCEGRTKADPHPERCELEWQMQFSDLEDRLELLERRAAEEDDEG